MTTGDVVYSLRFSLIKILPEPGFDLGSTAGESCVLTARLHMLYCSTLWYNCTVTAMRRMRIVYNNSLRRLFSIPKHNSASGMFVQFNIKSFGELLRSYIHSFVNRLQCSNNLILSSICESTVPMYSNIWTWWYDTVC